MVIKSSSLHRALSYFSFSVVGSLLAFFTVPYLTRMLSPQDFGFVGLFLSLFYVVGPLSSFSAAGLVGINKAKFNPEDYHRFSVEFIYFCFLIFLILVSIGVVTSIVLQKYYFICIFLPVLGIIRVLNGIHSTELVQDGHANTYGMLNLATAVFTFGFTVVLISIFDLSWSGRILAICGSEAFILSFRYLVISKRNFLVYSFPTVESIKEYLAYGTPVIVSLGATWAINEADKFIVLKYFTMADVGLYTAAYSVGLVVNVVNGAMVNAMAPKIYGSLNSKMGANFIRKLNLYYSVGILLFASVISIVAFYWSDWYFGSGYHGAYGIVSVTAFAFAFSGVYKSVSLVIDFYKKNTLKTVILYICALSNIILSIGLIPFLGTLSPAVGTLLSYILLAALVTWFGRRELIIRGVGA